MIPPINETNLVWQETLRDLLLRGSYAAPRGLPCREIIAGHYAVPMPAFIDLTSRHLNLPFMLAEAAWILSGSNQLDRIEPFMKTYARFSDDGVFMRGAYGPKVADQLPWVADCLVSDQDTRQAVLTTWRERPAPSRDIPCTLAVQFLLRRGGLDAIVTMRSQDIVLGFTYDVFTFSMIAEAVRRLVQPRLSRSLAFGTLHVTAGSLHLYESDLDRVRSAFLNPQLVARDARPGDAMKIIHGGSFSELVADLWEEAQIQLGNRDRVAR